MARRTEVRVRTEEGDERHAHRQHEPTFATQDLYDVARQLWERMQERRPLRFVAVSLTELAPASVTQLDLFAAGEQRSDRTSALMDQLRDRFGERAVLQASLLNRSHLAPDRIAFGKLPRSGGAVTFERTPPRGATAPLASRCRLPRLEPG